MATYRTERYIRYWRMEYTNQATYRHIGGRRIFAGYRSVARRVPVYGTRQVFTGWRTETRRVPRMVERTVLAGWDFVEKRVPEYDWVEVQDGWTTETVRIPRVVRKQVQVGTESRWVLERVPQRPPSDFNLQGSNPPARPQSDPAPPQSEPALVPVPSIWTDPVGWFQASMINAGRQSDTARAVLTGIGETWENTIQPIVQTVTEFFSGVYDQVVINNIDAAALLLKPVSSEQFMDDMLNVRNRVDDSPLDTSAYHTDRFIGALLGIAQGALEWTLGGGIGTIGTLTSCVGGLLTGPGEAAVCPAGTAASATAGAAVMTHGVVVGGVGIRDLVGQVMAISSKGGSGRASTPNQMNNEIATGKAPRGVKRVDVGDPNLHEIPHVHFDNGAALNINGTWKHGYTELTSSQIQWLTGHGWKVP